MPRGGFEHPFLLPENDEFLIDREEGFVAPTPGEGGRSQAEIDWGGDSVPDDVARNAAERRAMLDGPLPDAPTPTGWGSLSATEGFQAGANIGGAAGRGIAGIIAMFRGQPHALIDAYRKLSEQYKNLDDPEIARQVWNSPVLQQIARYTPEMVQGFHETMADFEGYEGDPELRAKEDAALATITERARRGDPEMQRLRSREAASAVGRGLARAGGTAQEQAARRGMPGQAAPGLAQAGAQYAGQVGTANVMASRKSQESAEIAALQGTMGVRKGRESQGQMAANLRNNFRSAMSNRQLAMSITNQKARQSASDKNQHLSQSLHERNLLGADQRRRENQTQQNMWEREEYNRDRQRLIDTGSLDIGIAREQDAARRREDENLGGILGGVGSIAGGFIGMDAAG